MKSTILSIVLFTMISCSAIGQNLTNASLFLRSDSVYTNMIQEESGDLYKTIGHHGPAVENEWLALRLYFNNKATSIDVYNKQKKGLELKNAKWYPSEKEQKKGLGADYYKVGSTVGLGGVRLWDGENVVLLAPVSNRIATVKKEANYSQMEMLSKDVPYKGKKIDVLVRVTAYTGIREMRVEAFAFTDEDVQFVTGINYHKGQKVEKADNYMIAWGYHPEDVAAEKIQVGAAIMINPDDYQDRKDDGKQQLYISKPTKYLSTWVTSTIEKDKKMGSFEKFKAYVVKTKK
ncbi:DUF4861 family protein [Labilibaculum euxinus]|uniref:DUF4861 domain-containing protein n=1 Tax=Labilibaculum euxinus TaxID=2686357 RepID=A0A7M4D1Y8_9BACT|nr:DUF4861 family protein [Labilibaculum euxinus]MUP36667.1 DUF4861 domain-containing protein [Labilibaculum euxinus]MVB05872.1 DUF4861 domain-containing protein [Labilibaculum euxinus]